MRRDDVHNADEHHRWSRYLPADRPAYPGVIHRDLAERPRRHYRCVAWICPSDNNLLALTGFTIDASTRRRRGGQTQQHGEWLDRGGAAIAA